MPPWSRLPIIAAAMLACAIDTAVAAPPILGWEQCTTTASGLGVCVIKPPSRPTATDRLRELLRPPWFSRPLIPTPGPEGPRVD
jgi:hypothetical protein